MEDVVLHLNGAYSATIGGERWSNITHDSRFFPAVQEWIAAGGIPDQEAPKSDAPTVVSDRQFATACALAGLIAPAEALAWVKTGELPTGFAAAVEALPASDRFGVEMMLSGATEFRREHPLTNHLGALLGQSAAQVDNLFRLAAQQ